MAEGARTALPYDVPRVRADFPILSREINGHKLVYLDNAASAQKPRAVIDKLKAQMEHSYANVHRGLHTLANETTEAYEGARARVAQFLNARELGEIVFTRGSTEAINLVAASYGRMAIREGDEIILSLLEHHSNIVPWHFLRERAGAIIKWAPIRDDGSLDLEVFTELLSSRTRLVAITHMSNALGTQPPVKEIVRLAHAAGAKVLIDGSQGAVHLPVDVQDLGCDFYVFTGHKLYGPTAIGALWARRELLEAMPPYQGGGEMIETVSTERVTYGPVPHKFEAGTPPILEAIGLHAAIDYVEGLGRAHIVAHEASLLKFATERLRALNSVHVHGEAAPKGSIISFSVKGAHAHDVAAILDRQGVAVRAGAHCAEPLMRRLGVTSTARVSFALYNTADEVETFGRAVEKAIGILR
jgi:cysteine desulfurase/selenocysteine lyase